MKSLREIWLLLGRKSELGRVIERERRRLKSRLLGSPVMMAQSRKGGR
jgi:hypothetical protein